jgi:N-(2-amino-2-carboxyethyl)-L-glutamate synthase
MRTGILATIGQTPLVRLERLFPTVDFKLYAKLEGFNPGGSIKDRAAITILQRAFETGDINSETTIVESSSGNMGIGLAQACSYFGLRFICVVDPKTTKQNIRILQVYGAEIDMVTEPCPETGEFLGARLKRVKSLCRTISNSFWPDQYANIYNARSHYQTMGEIMNKLGELDYLFCATSTCGTLRGCAEFVQEHKLRTRIIAVDAAGSAIFGGLPSKRLIPGHGAAVRPSLFQPNLAQSCIHVTDVDCVVGCRRLLHAEAILAGGSSGAVVMAIDRIKYDIEPDATCVAIFADRGERYLDTIFEDRWVRQHLGEIVPLANDASLTEPSYVEVAVATPA